MKRLLTRHGLIKVKTRALRTKVWFKGTSRLERGVVDLAIRCVEKIRSPVLAKIVLKIVRKLSRTMENGFLKLAEKVGAKIAERVCGIVVTWGNSDAISWKHDYNFIRFLGVNAVNVRVSQI